MYFKCMTLDEVLNTWEQINALAFYVLQYIHLKKILFL